MSRGLVASVVGVVLLGLGGGIGAGLGEVLGIDASPVADPLVVDAPPVPPVEAFATNPRLVVDAPSGPRFEAAVDELEQAQAGATGRATLTVRAGSATDTDRYRVTGSPRALVVTGDGVDGAVRGVYDVAAAVRSGRPVADLVGTTRESALPFRMVDLGAVGVTPDPAQWRDGDDYSHVSRAFADAFLPEAPYVDREALAEDYEEWDAFLRHVVAGGATAVAWPGFVEYADLPGAPAERAAALREAFTPFWDRADELGVSLYLRTDMLALTPGLEDHLDEDFGLDTEDPALWRVYTDALDRLYDQVPALDGILIRIGEGGSIYAEPGWDYYSEIAVRTPAAVRAMLTAFSDQAESREKEVVFRTWSVGIGAVGDLHTDPASYRQVLDGLDSPALVVSTKYVAGDFYSWLPVNPTLEIGEQRRIVEFQARREFEAFGSFPNDLGPELASALQQVVAANPHVEGVWTWTQDGGPWRAGPMTLYLQSGLWQLYEHEASVAAALARDPAADVAQVTVDWARRYLSTDPATVRAVAEAMALSRDAVRLGLYLRPFAEQRVTALGLEPPPQMWLFEWDVLTGDSATLDSIYAVLRDRVDETLADGEQAVALAREMRDLVAGTDPTTWHSPALHEAFVATLDYEVDVLTVLARYRALVLRAAQWQDTGSSSARSAWADAREKYDEAASAHLARYDGDVLHPAWNLTAAEIGVERAARDLPMAWTARVLLVLTLLWLLAAARLSAARATLLATVRPWAAAPALTRRQWAAALGVPLLLVLATRGVQTWFLAPAHLLVTLGAFAVCAVVTLLLGGRPAAGRVLLVLAGVSLLRALVALVALWRTGPGGYWFAFWTAGGPRTVYVAVAFALFVWLFVAAGWALVGVLGRRRATGAVLAGLGAGLGAGGLLVASYGLEEALTVWNDQLALLPWGLARILGITTYLEIPATAAWWAAAAGLVVLLLGLALRVRRPRRSAPAP